MGKITKDLSEDSLLSMIRVLNPESPEYEAGMLTINGNFHAIVLQVFLPNFKIASLLPSVLTTETHPISAKKEYRVAVDMPRIISANVYF
jgi:hypothetical protein